jgi:hypothetical protein
MEIAKFEGCDQIFVYFVSLQTSANSPNLAKTVNYKILFESKKLFSHPCWTDVKKSLNLDYTEMIKGL